MVTVILRIITQTWYGVQTKAHGLNFNILLGGLHHAPGGSDGDLQVRGLHQGGLRPLRGPQGCHVAIHDLLIGEIKA